MPGAAAPGAVCSQSVPPPRSAFRQFANGEPTDNGSRSIAGRPPRRQFVNVLLLFCFETRRLGDTNKKKDEDNELCFRPPPTPPVKKKKKKKGMSQQQRKNKNQINPQKRPDTCNCLALTKNIFFVLFLFLVGCGFVFFFFSHILLVFCVCFFNSNLSFPV